LLYTSRLISAAKFSLYKEITMSPKQLLLSLFLSSLSGTSLYASFVAARSPAQELNQNSWSQHYPWLTDDLWEEIQQYIEETAQKTPVCLAKLYNSGSINVQEARYLDLSTPMEDADTKQKKASTLIDQLEQYARDQIKPSRSKYYIEKISINNNAIKCLFVALKRIPQES